jgi:hypothetical protein
MNGWVDENTHPHPYLYTWWCVLGHKNSDHIDIHYLSHGTPYASFCYLSRGWTVICGLCCNSLSPILAVPTLSDHNLLHPPLLVWILTFLTWYDKNSNSTSMLSRKREMHRNPTPILRSNSELPKFISPENYKVNTKKECVKKILYMIKTCIHCIHQ